MKRCNSKVFSLMLVLCFESDQWECQPLRPPSPKETPSAATDRITQYKLTMSHIYSRYSMYVAITYLKTGPSCPITLFL